MSPRQSPTATGGLDRANHHRRYLRHVVRLRERITLVQMLDHTQ
jgi:hypothetical protein